MNAKETAINIGVSGFYAWFVYVLLVMATSGCASSTGWRFEIGISPVKQLDNRAGLSQEKEAQNGKRY